MILTHDMYSWCLQMDTQVWEKFVRGAIPFLANPFFKYTCDVAQNIDITFILIWHLGLANGFFFSLLKYVDVNLYLGLAFRLST